MNKTTLIKTKRGNGKLLIYFIQKPMTTNPRMAFILISFQRGSRAFLDTASVLGKYEELFLGSINVPIPESKDSAFGVLVKANTDQIGAITGTLGKIDGVKVKSALLPED